MQWKCGEDLPFVVSTADDKLETRKDSLHETTTHPNKKIYKVKVKVKVKVKIYIQRILSSKKIFD